MKTIIIIFVLLCATNIAENLSSGTSYVHLKGKREIKEISDMVDDINNPSSEIAGKNDKNTGCSLFRNKLLETGKNC